jgi:integral membrane protein
MKSAILRFRVMAIIAGVMSLLLWFVYMPVKYIFDAPELHSSIIWIPMVHGYLYPIYILTAIQFATKARWPIMKMLGLILAGTLPVASLLAERRVVRRYS